MRHTISILLENESGALSRVAGLFSARGYNIESLSVAPTEDETLSRLTLVTRGSDDIIEQITKQLNKLVDVVKLVDMAQSAHIERELMLIKVRATGTDRDDVEKLASENGAHILETTDTTVTVELTGTVSKLDDFIQALRAPIIETVRSGVTGIGKGEKSLHV